MGGGASSNKHGNGGKEYESVQVKEVLPGSESALNNVQIGDRILWVGNQNVSTSLYNDITSRLNSSQRPLTITFIREQEHYNQGQQNPTYNFFDVTWNTTTPLECKPGYYASGGWSNCSRCGSLANPRETRTESMQTCRTGRKCCNM